MDGTTSIRNSRRPRNPIPHAILYLRSPRPLVSTIEETAPIIRASTPDPFAHVFVSSYKNETKKRKEKREGEETERISNRLPYLPEHGSSRFSEEVEQRAIVTSGKSRYLVVLRRIFLSRSTRPHAQLVGGKSGAPWRTMNARVPFMNLSVAWAHLGHPNEGYKGKGGTWGARNMRVVARIEKRRATSSEQ